MNRERALKVVLVLVGLLFLAGVYPVVMYLWRPGNESPGDAMMLSLYVTLGVFLLLAARNPSANRSLIAFTAWSIFAHAALMAVQGFPHLIPPGGMLGGGGARLLWINLPVLGSGKQEGEKPSPGGAGARTTAESP